MSVFSIPTLQIGLIKLLCLGSPLRTPFSVNKFLLNCETWIEYQVSEERGPLPLSKMKKKKKKKDKPINNNSNNKTLTANFVRGAA